eukprot:3628878-Ditylum_brightwellii.AAC.1
MFIWSFKRKCHANESLSKHKARLCCHGGQHQWGVNFYETYAPVVTWVSVRTMMVMSTLYNLNTRSIDIILANPQTKIKANIYLFPPAGIAINTGGQDLVLKLKKNLYGLKNAGRTWWEHLASGLERMGLKQCEANQYVWKKDGLVIIVYVDNCLIFGNSKDNVDKVVEKLRKRFDIADEGTTVEEYLGVKIDHNKDGS